jgi:pyrroline-5-carboxylate reductase
MPKIVLIGGGNMASALLGGWKKKSLLAETWVVEPRLEQREWLAQHYPVQAVGTIAEAPLAEADIWVLAVKPQMAQEILAQLPRPSKQCVIISVMAGVRLETLRHNFKEHSLWIRTIPNTPALVQAGMTGLYATPEVPLSARQQVEGLFRSVGHIVWCETEQQLDAITALSGSGPGFVFYMMEAFLNAARELALPSHLIDELVKGTFAGAVALAQHSDETPETLRARVTSPGGTTEAGIRTLNMAQVNEHIQAAIVNAAHRATQIGDDLHRKA